MSYAQVKVYLTEEEIDDAILKAARDHMIPMESGKEFYVMDWQKTDLDGHAIVGNLAFKDKKRELPCLPE